MQRRFRLTSRDDFQRVRRFGRSFAHPLIVLIVLANKEMDTHFAVAAGRATGNAVKRNRVKRQMRAALQPYLSQIEPGWDAILIARQPIKSAEFYQIQKAVNTLLHKSGLLKASNQNE